MVCSPRIFFLRRGALALLAVAVAALPSVAETVRVATYNVENYLIMDRRIDDRWRPDYPKPEKEKTALRETIRAVAPDVLALQEMGGTLFLEELRRDLAAEGLDYPHQFMLEAQDQDRHVAVLSRLPFQDAHGHVDPDFPYFDEREKIKRGLLEAIFETNGVRWTIFTLHLKSKWTERPDDPQATRKRTGEAGAARNRILERYDPGAGDHYLIIGDFNDTKDTAPLRRFYRRGPVTISEPVRAADSRGHKWTHHWERQDLYSRVDFILASPALLARVKEGRAYIHDGRGSEMASDHRLVWMDLDFSDRSE